LPDAQRILYGDAEMQPHTARAEKLDFLCYRLDYSPLYNAQLNTGYRSIAYDSPSWGIIHWEKTGQPEGYPRVFLMCVLQKKIPAAN
jgi:hypothetical protein